MTTEDNPNIGTLLFHSNELVLARKDFLSNELLVLETLISLFSHEDDEALKNILLITITSKLSSEERYWIFFYGKAFSSEEVKAWLNEKSKFSNLPSSLQNLVKSGPI
ncbi:hypothetical protein AAGW04_12390 [Pectobacterium aroidearum]|uniref:hypothetical protein n=1 Tax=Pectobacterium aroidearum TaxID=1201031 RepID=UPI00315975A9